MGGSVLFTRRNSL